MIGLFKLMLGQVTATEEAILEKAIVITYSLKGITFDDDDVENKEIPVMSDLLSVVQTMEGGNEIAQRLEKYVS